MPGLWHNKMEGLFPQDMREVKFLCAPSNSNSNTCRRADILLNNKQTLEIQHSYISEEDITKRFNDWNKFGKEIIWLLDGNTGITLDKLSSNNFLLIFTDDWKYKSFNKTYEYILVEIADKIFKIELKKIKSSMIEIKEYKTLNETIRFLQMKPDNIWDFWDDDNTIKSVLSVHQQGAGNGKTYGIWKSICDNIDKTTYIILTKQHSAKTVIYEELQDQKSRYANGENVFHIENIINDTEENTEKHYVIKYVNKKSSSRRECTVIIGTIDSFCFNLANSKESGANYFSGIVDNIAEKGATKIKNGYMRYAGQYIQLSKETEIWIDEVQDLPVNYLHAISKIIYDTGCYVNVVGDKLQSLEYPNNFLTSVVSEGLPNIRIDIREPVNINRRIKVSNMEAEINRLCAFAKHDLPPIVCDDDIVKTVNTEPIKIMEDLPRIYGDDKIMAEKITIYCNKIMGYYNYEVETNGYLPNDFLIIFPIMKSNTIASELESKIQDYWVKKYDKKYTRYAYLHKHTEGAVINTKDSIEATRIMSIRSSKGDGRNVVFVLSLTESSLKLLSNKEKGLVYDSYIHVALTRAKKQIYFDLNKNKDDIHKLFIKCGYDCNIPPISKNIRLEKIQDIVSKDRIIKILEANNITYNSIIEEWKIGLKTQKRVEGVDWGYHCIKYLTYYYNIVINIIKKKEATAVDSNSHLFVILRIISSKRIVSYGVYDFWEYLDSYKNKRESLENIPLCKISDKPFYIHYHDIIYKAIKKVQDKIKCDKLGELSVYESIILAYLIELFVSKRYSGITPMDLYNITDFFHNKDNKDNKEQELFNSITNIRNIVNKCSIKKYKNVKWNIFKYIRLKSSHNYFSIYKRNFPIIGNNKDSVIHIILKSNISQLNFWDIMIEILFERFLIYNPDFENDKDRYDNKEIITYCFLLDDNSYIKILWKWDKMLRDELKKEIYHALYSHYQDNHCDIYNYYDLLIKKDEKLWKENPIKILDKIIQEIEEKEETYPNYIRSFFEDISTDIEEERDYKYASSFEGFNSRLNRKLEKYLNKYLEL